MLIWLTRTYFPDGTNGVIRVNGIVVCRTIELPWRQNTVGNSCIPEGEYFLEKRYSRRFKWHIAITGVPNRTFILFHPANNAKAELRGCIAPVTQLSGPGLGLMSRKATQKLYAIISKELNRGIAVRLIVES